MESEPVRDVLDADRPSIYHDDRRTDHRAIDPHYGHREVYRLLDCDPSIKPEPDPDSVSSDPLNAAVRQALQQLGGTSS